MAKSSIKSKRRNAQNERLQIVIVIGVVAVVFIGVLFVLISQANKTTGTVTSGKYEGIPATTTNDGAPVLGNPDAKITIMEFADFSCPHCREYQPTIDQIIETYVKTGKARFIYRPETFVGGQFSSIAAQGALCAGKQKPSAFWAIHDALYDMQVTRGYQAFTVDTMRQLASGLNLDADKVASCVANSDTQQTLNQTSTLGQQLGVTGTPAILYSTDGTNFQWWTDNNGQKVPGGVAFDTMAATIEKANG